MNERLRKITERQRKLKLAELKPLLQDYHKIIPEWDIHKSDTLFRAVGPALQLVYFERSASRTYRPMACVRILAAPGGGGLDRHLEPVRLRAHSYMLPKMIEAMRHEIVPSIESPLEPNEVLDLCEREAIPKSPEAYSLAALNAYLGDEQRALYWCGRFLELVAQAPYGWAEWDVERGDFLKILEGWIMAGEVREQLDKVVQSERQKWGLS
ncbi:MAG: hypothetical protein GY778_11685 [bacterium]|nr:hypothetical protein [bacterium]